MNSAEFKTKRVLNRGSIKATRNVS